MPNNIFKIVSIALAIVIGIVAMLIFSGKFPGVGNTASENKIKPTLNVWGTTPRADIDKAMLLTAQATGKPFQFTYTEYDKSVISEKLIEADAIGGAPDLVLAPAEIINYVTGLLYVIPYSYMDELTYNNMFIDSSHMYNTPYGVQAYPVTADPLVTYYNKKIFRESGLLRAPASWLDLPKYQDKLTIGSDEGVPAQSAFGIGANNVVNSKGILVASLMQLGHNPARPLYTIGDGGALAQSFSNDLGTQGGGDGGEGDLYKTLRFQTAFSDPQKTVYTWSEVDRSDYDKFISGRSAIYFGKASDYYKILSESPNLELGIDYLPQMSNEYNVTTGDLVGVGVTKSTTDFAYAVEMAQALAGGVFGTTLANIKGISSARKDVLAGADGSERSSVISGSAITMQMYYDYNFKTTDSLVYSLYDDILSGRRSIEKAVEVFERSFVNMYKKY